MSDRYDLTPCTPAELQAHLETRAADAMFDDSAERDRWASQIVELMGRVRAAGGAR